VWTLLQSDYAHPGGDRTAGDNDALASAANKLRYLGGEACKLFCVEGVGARPSENAGAELEENAPGFSGHAELLSKSENESAQKQFLRFYRELRGAGRWIKAVKAHAEAKCEIEQNVALLKIRSDFGVFLVADSVHLFQIISASKWSRGNNSRSHN
jgi:hypothetical protein